MNICCKTLCVSVYPFDIRVNIKYAKPSMVYWAHVNGNLSQSDSTHVILVSKYRKFIWFKLKKKFDLLWGKLLIGPLLFIYFFFFYIWLYFVHLSFMEINMMFGKKYKGFFSSNNQFEWYIGIGLSHLLHQSRF